MYAGPLRMLAQEAHRRLSAELGEDAVGLVTGEERVNDQAPIICCTVEMAPSSGEVLVLDEVQWADDPERGSAWTRLLLAGDYRHILLLGALDAEPLVLRAFPEAEVKVFERMLPLEFVGERPLRGLDAGHGRRRLQPQGRARARRRDQPAPSEQRLGALRRHAAQLATRGDRPLPQRGLRCDRRDGCARARRQSPLRDAALRRDDEVRRRVAPRPAALGARPDRGSGRAVRARRARARRRPDGRVVGERRPRDRRGGAAAARAAAVRATSATGSSTRRGSGRGSPIWESTTRVVSTRLSQPGIGSRLAPGRTRAGSPSSR